MSFTEKNLQSLVTKYFKKNRPIPCKYCGCYNENGELKLVKNGKKFYFKSIRQNQSQGLWDGKYLGIMWKHSDSDQRLKPCDYSYFQGNGYLGICWYKPRQPKIVYFIDIDTLLTEMKSCVSLKEDRARLIASKVIEI